MGEQPVGPAAYGAPAPVAPPSRRQAPTWVVVAATVGVMVAIGLAFVVGVFVGAYVTRDSGATTAGTTGGTTGGGTDDPDEGSAPPAGGGSLDDCVVGSWRSTEHTEDWKTDQGQAQLSGLERTMVFTADGTQTITYDGATATITAQGTDVPARFDGEVVYRTTTSGGTMSFELVQAEGSVTVDPDGQAKVEDLEPGTGDVSYSCDDTTLRQEAEGYLSVYERTS